MSIPSLYFCCHREKIEAYSENAPLLFGLACLDALAAITFLVVGILGSISVIHMAPALPGSLIGVSVGIALLWISMVVNHRYCKEPD